MNEIDFLKEKLHRLADLILNNEEIGMEFYQLWIEKPHRVFVLLDLLDSLSDDALDDQKSEYSACIVAMDICVAHIQSAAENGQKSAELSLQKLMDTICDKMLARNHSLPFWMPVLNAFYDVQIELSSALKNAYLLLAQEYDDAHPTSNEEVIESIQDMLEGLAHLSIFERAEHIFAQSFVMQEDLFAELLYDLLSLEEGLDIAILSLMHPSADIRTISLEIIGSHISDVMLGPAALSRLQSISYWHTPENQAMMQGWIKAQRKKGAVFAPTQSCDTLRMKACEIDGSGTQGLALMYRHQGTSFLAGILVKSGIGIKDVWVNAIDTFGECQQQYQQLLSEDIYTRAVDNDYLRMICQHFLSESLGHAHMPALQFLQLQEQLGVHFVPEPIALHDSIEALSVELHPFTQSKMQEAIIYTRKWEKDGRFSQSWFVENSEVDALVNRCCTLEENTKACDLSEALPLLINEIFSKMRNYWCFHFFWNALWLKSTAQARERSWKDCLFLAYFLDQGGDMMQIPVMYQIAQQSVINSMETMTQRRTHLSTLRD